MDRRRLLQTFAASLLVPAGFAGAQFVRKPAATKAPSVEVLQRDWK
jgi:hypothetical protein